MPRRTGDRHYCWNEVDRFVKEGKNHPEVVCKHCSHSWTSNARARVLAHLAECKELPPHLWQEYQEERIATGQPPKRPKPPPPPRQQQQARTDLAGDDVDHMERDAATQACAQWVHAAGLPPQTVEHPAFVEFMHVLRPDWVPPGRWELKSMILEEELRYSNLQQEMSRALERNDSRILVSDGLDHPRDQDIVSYLPGPG